MYITSGTKICQFPGCNGGRGSTVSCSSSMHTPVQEKSGAHVSLVLPELCLGGYPDNLCILSGSTLDYS